MSDLAPFVAAAIRDRVVEDLMEEIEKLRQENERLRQEKDEMKVIRLTGKHGTPVYFKQRFADLGSLEDDRSHFNLEYDGPPISIEFGAPDQAIEIWVEGHLLASREFNQGDMLRTDVPRESDFRCYVSMLKDPYGEELLMIEGGAKLTTPAVASNIEMRDGQLGRMDIHLDNIIFFNCWEWLHEWLQNRPGN